MSGILVTGSNGQLALDLINFFNSESYKITGKSREELDITNIEQIKKVITEEKPEWIVNCAAFTNLDEAESNPEKAFRVNYQGVNNLASVCTNFDIGLIHISTDAIFADNDRIFFRITDIPNPINMYGISKMLGELAIMDKSSRYWILRSSWIYGERGGRFFNSVLNQIKLSRDFSVVNDQFGQPTSTSMIFKALLSILTNKTPEGIHHVVPNEYISRYEFAVKIKQAYEIVCGEVSSSRIFSEPTKLKRYIAPRAKYSLLEPCFFDETYGKNQEKLMDQILEMVVLREMKNLR